MIGKRHIWLSAVASAALLLGLAPSVSAAPDPAQTQAFQAIIRDFEAFWRSDDPVGAGNLGDQAALARLPDPSLSADQRRQDTLTRLAERLQRLDPRGLSEADQLNLALLHHQIDDTRAELADDAARLPFTAYWSFSSFGPDLGRSTHLTTLAEANAYLTRLGGLASYYDAQIANARRGLATGFTQPKRIVLVSLATAKREAEASVETSPMLAPLKASDLPVSAEARKALVQRAQVLLETQILPAQKRIVVFLQNEYLPRARESLAIRDVPGGEAYYRHCIRHFTTTDLSPDEIHEIGLAEVRHLRAEMEKLVAATGFSGSFAEFLKYLRTDPQFYAKSREELLLRYRAKAKEIDPLLPRLIGTLPRLTYGVRPIPDATEEGQTTAYYELGAPERGEAGYVGVNLSHLDQRPLYEIPTLLLHEGAPGHHVQLALAAEIKNQPEFRRRLDFTAFVEGWALYAEQLGKETDLYATPYERFSQLSYDMWRACRLVADTGVHWKRWTVDQARACFLENTALSQHNIDTEVDRYISWPGQALAYKMGELRIMALRHEAEAALGERFDLRAFHDTVLSGGALPLDILAARVRAWIATQGTSGGSKTP